MKAVCPSCKKEYDLQDKVCKKCGEPLVIVDEDGFELVDLHQKGQFTSESLNRNTYVEPIEDKQMHPVVKGILILHLKMRCIL